MAHRGRRSADESLAVALAGGATLRDAARSVGVGERTATRRAADPAFRARVEALRADLVASAVGQLAGLLTDAVATLKRGLTCGSPAVEVRAALGVIDQLLKVREQTELEARMQALEARAKEARAKERDR